MWYNRALFLLCYRQLAHKLHVTAACDNDSGRIMHMEHVPSVLLDASLLTGKVGRTIKPHSYNIANLKFFVFETLDKSCILALNVCFFKGATSKKHSTGVGFSSQRQKIGNSSTVVISVHSSAMALKIMLFESSSK